MFSKCLPVGGEALLLLTELLSSMEELRVSDSLEESDEMKTNLKSLPGQTGVVTNHLCNCHFFTNNGFLGINIDNIILRRSFLSE